MPPPAPTPVDECRAIAARLKAKAEEWHALPASDKLSLLEQCRDRLARPEVMEAWIDASCGSHGYDRDDPAQAHLVAETYVTGPATCGLHMAGLHRRLESLAKDGRLPQCAKTEARPGGLTRVTTFPAFGMLEKLAANGATGQLHVDGEAEQPTAEELRAELEPGLVAVLGAGNYEAPTEALHFLFAEERVVAFKVNPVNAAAARGAEEVFRPLIDAGYLAFLYGGVDEGQALIHAPEVDEVCMTGSARAFNHIYWGRAEAPAADDDGAEPVLKKKLTAELGSVNPYVVVPAKWSDSELEAQASQLAAAKRLNAGHICVCPAVVITDRAWPQREKFIERVRHYLTVSSPQRAYYPNARRSYDTFRDKLAEETGAAPEELAAGPPPPEGRELDLPVVFAAGITADSHAVTNESFAPVLTELPLDVPDGGSFLDEALRLVHDKMWGTLSATLIVHPSREQDEDVQRFIDEVRVGALGVNVYAAFIFMYSQLAWGAYGDGHSPHDIQSGNGRVSNAYGFRRVRKATLRFPFTYIGQPEIVTSPAAQLKQMRRLAEFAVKQSGWPLFKLIVNAVTGL